MTILILHIATASVLLIDEDYVVPGVVVVDGALPVVVPPFSVLTAPAALGGNLWNNKHSLNRHYHT
jgi:hypothetical protein